MKKIAMLAVISMFVAGTVFAQAQTAPVANTTAPAATTTTAKSQPTTVTPEDAAKKTCTEKKLTGAAHDECVKTELAKVTKETTKK